MEEIMQSNAFFIVPLTIAYGAICGLWFYMNSRTNWWPLESIKKSDNPWLDFSLSLIAAAGILGIGQLYSAGYLVPSSDGSIINSLTWILNNLIIFSPIAIVLLMRKQKLSTVFISLEKIHLKLAFGALGSIVGIVIFLLLRGELSRLPSLLAAAIQLKSLSYFPAIFLENISLAFLFVRLKWAIGTKWAIIIPAILFAFSHVPGSLAEGDPWSHIITFFFLTGSLTTFILYTAYRSRDIIWLGIVHYMMDIVIKAF
ncbi:MAG: CPBP family glutamic-type intramembrane protease [Cyclobacteriaceae bacterium]